MSEKTKMLKWTLLIITVACSTILISCSKGYYGTPDAGAAVMTDAPKPHADHSCTTEDCGNVLVTEPEDYDSTDVSTPTPEFHADSNNE